LAVLLWFPPLAQLLGQAVPPLTAAVVAVGAIPAVLAVDALHKQARTRARTRVHRSAAQRNDQLPVQSPVG
jgi:hypothetical protein